mgnify:CR=1 FL=1
MEYYTEVKLMGDAYGAGFSNGLTMCGRQSAAAFRKVEDMGPDAVYDDDRQHRIVLHKKAAGQAVEVSTEFINDSAEAVTLEMLSSFAIRGINADRIHRLQSFWSAEGIFPVSGYGRQQKTGIFRHSVILPFLLANRNIM